MLDRPKDLKDKSEFPAELLIWLSPAFPVGAFAYSQGLETAVARGWVSDPTSLQDWLSALARNGALRNDLILLSLVRRAPSETVIIALAELAAALQPSKERAEESLTQGQAFLDAYNAAWAHQAADPSGFLPDGSITLPVAIGLATRAQDLSLSATLMGYGTAFCTNLISAAIRLGVIGQFDGQRVLANLLPELREQCLFAETAAEDDLGSATFAADLASIQHETQTTRLFRS